MGRTPEFVEIGLREVVTLLNFRHVAATSHEVGELGVVNYEEILETIDVKSTIQVKPAHLADLVYHMKEAVFSQLPPMKIDARERNHNKIMRKLKANVPSMFKELPTGEVVMVELEKDLEQ